MARVSRRPSSSGNTTFMARSAGDSPRGEDAQASCALPDSTTCSTGTSAASSTVVSSARRPEKAVVLRMIAGLRAWISSASTGSAAGSLRLDSATPDRRQPLGVERGHQRGDWRRIGRDEIGAVEDHQRRWALILHLASRRSVEDGHRADGNRRRCRGVAAEQGAG
jgi:hypothetical protein